MADLGALEHVLARTTRRIRLGRAIAWLGHGLTLGLSLSALHELVLRLRGQAPQLGLDVALVLGSVLVASLVRLGLRVAREEAASQLDRAHDLHDRVRSAVEFARLPDGERTRFMEAALRDSRARARELSAERAVRYAKPRGLHHGLVPLAVWLAVVLWPAPEAAATTKRAPSRARVLDDDDLDAFRGELSAFAERAALTAEARADVSRYNALLEQLATGELDRAKALEALLSLEKKLLERSDSSEHSDRAALEELARDLARADEALAEALQNPDEAERAAQAMKKLAERAAKGELTAEEARRLNEALERIRKREEERQKEREREGELTSLLKKKQEQPPTDPGEKSLFEKQRRELERLRRDNAEAQKRHRELERLSRDLADGAKPESQGGGQQSASDALSRGAEDLKRFDQDGMTQEQRKDLARQVQQLREMMQRQAAGQGGSQQQQGQGQGQDQGSRAQRFRLRAQGQDPDQAGAQIVMKKPGAGKDGKPGEEGEEGEQGQQGGKPGEPGQGKDGQQGQGEGEGQGKGQGQAQGPGQGQGQQVLELGGDGPANAIIEVPGEGGGSPERVRGEGAGDAHDPNTLKTATSLDAQHDDSRLEGTHGKGATRSEVILDAADRGFATSSYRKVYTDYRAHAEDVLERDQVPPGYRFYVRRYFQLIRPRDRKESP